MVRNQKYIDHQELRRRKRERIIIVITIVVIFVLTLLENRISQKEAIVPISNNILVFGLININIILILLLVFLIVRNVVKLIFERRHGVLGSKLRTKLVAAFVSLSLIPTAILFLVAVNFLSYSIENWFNITIGDALNKTVEIAQVYYQQTSDHAKFYARQISSDITKNRLYDRTREEYLKALIDQRQRTYKLGLLEIYFNNQKDKLIVKDPNHPDISPGPLSPKMLEDVFSGQEISAVHPLGTGDLISGLAPIYSHFSPTEVIGVAVVSYYIPKALVDKIGVISKTSEQYKQLSLLKNPIKFSYMITLFIVTLLIVFSATWFGLFLAKGITVPIQDLAEATKKIARGELEHQIDIVADDEIGVLVNSFNKMTKDLKKSKENLEQANFDLEGRRKYMETVLGNVSAGVVSVDKNDVITIINKAAENMLEINTEKVMNKRYQIILNPEHMALVDELLRDLQKSGKNFVEKQIELTLKDRVLTVLMTTTLIHDDEGHYMGMVVVFEDLTQIQKAERAAAWREVARRMAHEIKNPLTPVQLSAQRLQKKYGDKLGDDSEVFHECTRTIIDQVEVLKNLVNAFSRYAKMPATNPTPHDLNDVINDSATLFKDAHKDIRFDFQLEADIPKIIIDAEQIKRVMVNLLDNAIAAMDKQNGHIVVRTSYDKTYRKVRIEVADNGCGVPYGYKAKMFEPYFSTKSAGTGLGLAIVSSIISDHHGHVSVRDNIPKGTIVAFELPVSEGVDSV
ncbi:MAG: ATP-binding protein [Deltaproteobacteria bacterium]|nr:ATP-binding protein [Deltaproteobacteria bacterium]